MKYIRFFFSSIPADAIPQAQQIFATGEMADAVKSCVHDAFDFAGSPDQFAMPTRKFGSRCV